MRKAIVTTFPFGKTDNAPCDMLQQSFDVKYNQLGKKYTKNELQDVLIRELPDIIIAGTEKYTADTINLVPNLRLIARVGIGVDNIDLEECKRKGITVTNTPSAPSNAVAELTICQMLNMLRKVQNVSEDLLKKERWNRYIGREIKNCQIGVIGVGRIGTLVIHKLECLTDRQIYINDVDPDKVIENVRLKHKSVDDICRECDIITIHIPLKDSIYHNKDLITTKQLSTMKRDVRLLNMSRGGIINEGDLFKWLSENKKVCVAVDSFETEAYRGKLLELGNAYLTPHLGSCTIQSRSAMECGAVKEAISFNTGLPQRNEVV